MQLHLKIGTRTSPLALKQTGIFVGHLKKFCDFTYEIISIKTTGDTILSKPLYDIGGKGLFLKELEAALETEVINVAIHSLKDIPGVISKRFTLPLFISREYPYDVLISKNAQDLMSLPANARVGTCSPRRISLIKKNRPDIEIIPIRGNIGTRFNVVLNNELDAIILAEAGLRRMDMYNDAICHRLDVNHFIPAAGQGVIAAEVKSSNTELISLLSSCSDIALSNLIQVERGFLKTLNADCDSPVGAYVQQEADGSFVGRFMYGINIEDELKFLTEAFTSADQSTGILIANKMLGGN